MNTQKQTHSCSFCWISFAIKFVFQRENQFMMTIRRASESQDAPAAPWEGRKNAANLGKMNHSHFIWTSVLPPPSSSPPPLLARFIHM